MAIYQHLAGFKFNLRRKNRFLRRDSDYKEAQPIEINTDRGQLISRAIFGEEIKESPWIKCTCCRGERAQKEFRKIAIKWRKSASASIYKMAFIITYEAATKFPCNLGCVCSGEENKNFTTRFSRARYSLRITELLNLCCKGNRKLLLAYI